MLLNMSIENIKGNSIVFFLASLLLFTSCKKRLDISEYKQWVKNEGNGLYRKREVAGIRFEAQYKPIEFIVLSKSHGEISKEILARKVKELDGMQYYDLKITVPSGDLIKNGTSSMDEVYKRMYYFSFGFQNDIKLDEDGKLSDCKLFHFERTYDLKASKVFVLGFDASDKPHATKTLRIDSPYLGTGVVNIKFEEKDLKDIPDLKL